MLTYFRLASIPFHNFPEPRGLRVANVLYWNDTEGWLYALENVEQRQRCRCAYLVLSPTCIMLEDWMETNRPEYLMYPVSDVYLVFTSFSNTFLFASKFFFSACTKTSYTGVLSLSMCVRVDNKHTGDQSINIFPHSFHLNIVFARPIKPQYVRVSEVYADYYL